MIIEIAMEKELSGSSSVTNRRISSFGPQKLSANGTENNSYGFCVGRKIAAFLFDIKPKEKKRTHFTPYDSFFDCHSGYSNLICFECKPPTLCH